MIPLAVFGSVVIGVILLVFVNKKSHTNPYIVILQGENGDVERAALETLAQKTQKCVIKSKTISSGQVELHYEIRLKDENTAFVDELSQLPGVTSAVLVSYNGDYMG